MHLARRYREGERVTCRVKATNENWKYEIEATGVVKKDSTGRYTEEYAWSNLISNLWCVEKACGAHDRSVPVAVLGPAKLVGPIVDFHAADLE
jgi:hypothetical protein